MFQKITDIVHGIVEIDPELPLRDVPFYKKTLRFIYTVVKVFFGAYGFQRAAALAFATLFGIFPLVAVLLFLVPVFFGSGGMDQTVGKFILTYILPATSDMEQTLKGYFDVYQRGATQIGVVGLIALLGAGIALFIIVEQIFNDIWRVERRRSFLKASTVFAGVIVWMPLFIGLSIYLTREFTMRAEAVSTNFMNLLPFFLVFLGFTLAYLLIPNTHVNFISAMSAALVAAFLWEVARTLFDRTVYLFPTLNLVQNVGAIPYFLIWLYINWIIILLGVIIAYCLQNYKLLLREDISYSAVILDPVVLLMMLFFVGRKFQAARGAVDMSELRNLCPISPKSFLQHIGYLEKSGFIMSNPETESVILSRPPDKIPLKDIFTFFHKAKTMFHFSVVDESGHLFLNRLKEMEHNFTTSLRDKSLQYFLADNGVSSPELEKHTKE